MKPGIYRSLRKDIRETVDTDLSGCDGLPLLHKACGNGEYCFTHFL